MQGNNYQIDKEPLMNIPIPVLPKELEDPIIELVSKILDIKKMNPLKDTSLVQEDLDLLFYKIYRLSHDDINIIKTSIE